MKTDWKKLIVEAGYACQQCGTMKNLIPIFGPGGGLCKKCGEKNRKSSLKANLKPNEATKTRRI